MEDEFHFLCQCPMYAFIRRDLYRAITQQHYDFGNMDDQAKFVYMMKSQQKLTAVATELMWNKRMLNIYTN